MADAVWRWVSAQAELADALGLPADGWIEALGAACRRRGPLSAAIIVLARQEGLPISVIRELDSEGLIERMQRLLRATSQSVQGNLEGDLQRAGQQAPRHPVLAAAQRAATDRSAASKRPGAEQAVSPGPTKGRRFK